MLQRYITELHHLVCEYVHARECACVRGNICMCVYVHLMSYIDINLYI